MKYILILLGVYLLNLFVIYRLRKKRDNINLTTYEGKLECLRLNKKIDILTGAWLWKSVIKK